MSADTRPEFPEMRRLFADEPTLPTTEKEPRVDHAAEARAWLDTGFRTSQAEYETRCVAMAQVHATLAVVEQQRIANLITFAQVGPDLAVTLDDLRIGTAGDVWEALGL